MPHLEPYYATYAAPYVDLVRPYYHTVDERVIAPGWGYTKKHGAPRVERAQAFAHAQWQKNVQPQITKGQDLAKLQYNQNLAPHVNRVSATLGPYVDIARTSALQTYHELLLPTYTFVQPYALQGYQAASTFTKGTAIPSAVWAWNKTYLFLDSTVWPHLRVIYVENVEPQLIKIGKRLGRYSSGKKTVPKPIPEVLSRSVFPWFLFPRPRCSLVTAQPARRRLPLSSSHPLPLPPWFPPFQHRRLCWPRARRAPYMLLLLRTSRPSHRPARRAQNPSPSTPRRPGRSPPWTL